MNAQDNTPVSDSILASEQVFLESPEQLDLSHPHQVALDEMILKEGGSVDNLIQNAIHSINLAQNHLGRIPLNAWQRAACRLNEKAKESGQPQVAFDAEAVWVTVDYIQHLFKLGQKMEAHERANAAAAPIEDKPCTDQAPVENSTAAA